MKFSLTKKTIILVVCINVVISLCAVAIISKGIRDVIQTQYEERSLDIANLVSLEIDSGRLRNVQKAVCEIYTQTEDKVMSDQWGTPAFDAYIARFAAIEEMDDYQALLADLRRMQDVLNVDCLYCSWLDVERECYVYLVDAAYEDPCPPGCIDPVFLENAEALKNPAVGFPPNITNTPEYGWLIATGMPVFDEQGEIVAFAAVDISMNTVMELEHQFLLYSVLIFLAVTVVLCLLSIWAVTRFVTRPINTLSRAAAQYTRGKKTFSGLNISAHDEIGILAESMARMEADINDYIDNLERTTGDLLSAREHAEQLNRIANIDPLTKVRNKRAFDVELARLEESTQPYGIIMVDLNGLKMINDTCGHEKGNISIVNLCRIICQTFKHSPVFRVGGDEFIVILENDDYRDREALIRSIREIFRENAARAELPIWERVTAAVGYAVSDPTSDKGVDSVLKRADEAMYTQKRAMKETESLSVG